MKISDDKLRIATIDSRIEYGVEKLQKFNEALCRLALRNFDKLREDKIIAGFNASKFSL